MTDMTMTPEHRLRREGLCMLAPANPHKSTDAFDPGTAAMPPDDRADLHAPASRCGSPVGTSTPATAADVHRVQTDTALPHELRWNAAMRGDGATAIGVALDMLPPIAVGSGVDSVTTARRLCAPEDSGTIIPMLVHILGRPPAGESDRIRSVPDRLAHNPPMACRRAATTALASSRPGVPS